MKAKIEKCRLNGKINAPKSKSAAHRLLIAAALAEGTSIIEGIPKCDDIQATTEALRALGAKITKTESTYSVDGINIFKSGANSPLYAKESGSTLRFLIPLASLTGRRVTLSGDVSLMKRPLGIYEEIFSSQGLTFEKSENEITLSGALAPGEYKLPGNVSSQFITGLLFALPLLDSDSVIKIAPPIESKPYIDMTLDVLGKFGIDAYFADNFTIKIPGGQKYKATNAVVEGDFSGAAFLDAFNLFDGSSVEVSGLLDSSLQGDKAYRDIYPKLKNEAPTINIENCPDLGPILFALAAVFNGAVFSGTARLKIKESDRAAVMTKELSKFGATVELYENSAVIKKAPLHAPSEILCGHNDHRVVMALSVLLTLFGGEIEGAEATKKSYPDFFSDIKSIGAEVILYE